MHSRPIDRLDQRHMMSVLLYLLDNGTSIKTDIYNNISRNSNMSQKIDRMVDLGLVTTTLSVHGVYVDLTFKGSQVAMKLRSVEEMLRDHRSHIGSGIQGVTDRMSTPMDLFIVSRNSSDP